MTWQDDERRLIASDLENRAAAISALADDLHRYELYCEPRQGVNLYQEVALLRAAAAELRAKAAFLTREDQTG